MVQVDNAIVVVLIALFASSEGSMQDLLYIHTRIVQVKRQMAQNPSYTRGDLLIQERAG